MRALLGFICLIASWISSLLGIAQKILFSQFWASISSHCVLWNPESQSYTTYPHLGPLSSHQNWLSSWNHLQWSEEYLWLQYLGGPITLSECTLNSSRTQRKPGAHIDWGSSLSHDSLRENVNMWHLNGLFPEYPNMFIHIPTVKKGREAQRKSQPRKIPMRQFGFQENQQFHCFLSH